MPDRCKEERAVPNCRLIDDLLRRGRFFLFGRHRLQMSYLDVTEAPDIVDELSPSEERVMENGQLKLMCKARGHPAPRITWRREDGDDLMLTPQRPSEGECRSS